MCRVTEEESLFDGYCQATDSQSAIFCDCAYNSVSVCGQGRDVFQCGKTDTAQRQEVEDACNASKRSCKNSKRSKSSGSGSRSRGSGGGSGSRIDSDEQQELNTENTAELDKGGCMASPFCWCMNTWCATMHHNRVSSITLQKDFCFNLLRVSVFLFFLADSFLLPCA